MLQRMQDRGQSPVVQLYMESQTLPNAPSRNLIIEIPGTAAASASPDQPEEYVVVGGHSDSWDVANGAMDDGGGIIASWEAARIITALGLQPLRTLRFVMWVNEENGLAGGNAYAADYNATLNHTSIAIESDEGAFSPYQLVFSGHQAAYNQLTLLAPLLEPLGAASVAFVSGAPGADISPTCAQGVPCAGLEVRDPRSTGYPNNPCRAFFDPSVEANAPKTTGQISDGYFWYHHTASDTIDRMDPNQLQAVAATLAVWAVTIGNLPALLPRNGDVPPLPDNTPGTGKLPTGVIVGIACGGVAVVALAVALFIFGRSRRWCARNRYHYRLPNADPGSGGGRYDMSEKQRRLTLVEQLGGAYTRDESFVPGAVPMYH